MVQVTELVVVEGTDAASYLDSQCTQDLSSLGVGDQSATLLLDPKGELVTVAVVRATTAGRVELEVPLGTGEASVARLRRFAIRSDVQIRLDAMPPVAPTYPDDLARICARVPGAAELRRGLVPHGLDESVRARCVSFTKGCYPGQELVARMEARGATPPYVLRELTAPIPLVVGDEVGDASLDGVVTSVALDASDGRCHALAVLHRRDAGADAVEVRHAGGQVLAHLE